MHFKMKQEKVHELEEKCQAKVKRLTVFPIWKKISTKMKQGKVHQLREKFQRKVEKSTMLPALKNQKKKNKIKTKPKQQQQKKQFYELYDETGKSSGNFKSKSREVDHISNINNIHEKISPC